jgi:hypothetical protein
MAGERAAASACRPAFGSYIATVTEVEVDASGDVRVQRIVSAVDTGIVVNPDTVIAQIQGGLVFGVTAALYGEVTLRKGRVQQSNFHNYRCAANRPDARDRGASGAERRSSGGIGEAGTTGSSAGAAQRHPSRRPELRCAACRSIASCWPARSQPDKGDAMRRALRTRRGGLAPSRRHRRAGLRPPAGFAGGSFSVPDRWISRVASAARRPAPPVGGRRCSRPARECEP